MRWKERETGGEMNTDNVGEKRRKESVRKRERGEGSERNEKRDRKTEGVR